MHQLLSPPVPESDFIPELSIQHSDCLTFLSELPSSYVDVIITDPAYSGMNQHLSLGRGRIVGDYSSQDNSRWFEEFHDTPDNYRQFLSKCHRVMKSNSHIYLMFDSFSLLTLGPIVREFFDVKNIIVWDKVNLGMGHYFRRRHEHIVFASKGKRKLSRRDIPDVWPIKRLHRAAYPTQKPVELFEMMLCGSVEPGDMVCDPFIGSGSSAIAALKRGCSFTGCDISLRAVEMAENRCHTFLGTGRDEFQTQPCSIQEPFTVEMSFD